MIYGPVTQEGIDTDSRFVEDEQFGIVEKSDSERDASLLSATERSDESVTGWQIEQLKEKFHLRFDKRIGQIVHAAEIFQRLFDCKFAIESQFLRHVTDSWTGNATLLGPGLTAKDVNFSTVETATTDDATQ